MLTQPTSAGVAQVVKDLSEQAAMQGIDVTVVSPQWQWQFPTNDQTPIHHLDVGMKRAPGVSDFTAFVQVVKIVRDADLVVAHASKAGVLGRLAAALLRKPVIFMPHGWSWHAGESPMSRKFYRLIELVLKGLATRVVAVGSSEFQQGEDCLGLGARQVLIPNGIVTSRFADLPAPSIEGDVLVLGRFCDQKGQDLAVRILARSTGSWRLRLVGDGDSSPCRQLAEQLDIPSTRLVIEGRRDAAQTIGQCAVVLMPSRWEGLPLVLLEAIAAGRIVVASGAASAGLEPSPYLRIVDREEEEFISASAHELDSIFSTGQVSPGRAGIDLVRQQYDLQETAAQHIALWRSLCAR